MNTTMTEKTKERTVYSASAPGIFKNKLNLTPQKNISNIGDYAR